jgi:predicted metalloprotease with PDZ domain
MSRRLLLALALVPAPLVAQRGAPVVYEIAFPNAAHHEAQVTATFSALPAGPLVLEMSRSSPGRYALHEFAKNVYAVKAFDSKGRALDPRPVTPSEWSVAGHDGTVRVTYTVFGDRVDGTYLAVDPTHAHIDMPAAFIWARGLETRPIRVTFRRADPSWRVATQLFPTSDSSTFTAPHLQYFFDSPTEVGPFELFTWTEPSAGRTPTIRLALHHLGTREEAQRYADMVKRVVHEAKGVFGELAPFDSGTYTFIADYLPWANGDGMEHRNSTIITSSGNLANNAMGLLGTVSHEFFHSWNVERVRPKTLEPFDFTRANMSGELWLAEGFTQYYGPLILHRAGLTKLPDFARGLGFTVDQILNAPGRRLYGPVGMSRQAPFVDAAVSIDPQNRQNTFISYYTYGAGIALALDLSLRERGVTLDDFMREMWRTHGAQRDFNPVRPYTLEDVHQALVRASKDRAFADDFYTRYMLGNAAPDYAALLARAGLLVRPARTGTAWMGETRARFDSTGASFDGGTLIGTPLYEAGVDRGDHVTSIDGRPLRSQADIDAVLAAHKPGDAIPLRVVGRAGEREARLTLREDPHVEVVTFEDAGRPVTDEITRFRAQWLGSRVDRGEGR